MGQLFILRSRVQQEYKSLLVNALNRIFTKQSVFCLHNWSFSAFETLYPVLENASEMDTPGRASKSRPLWAAHTRFGNVWVYPPPPRGRSSLDNYFRIS